MRFHLTTLYSMLTLSFKSFKSENQDSHTNEEDEDKKIANSRRLCQRRRQNTSRHPLVLGDRLPPIVLVWKFHYNGSKAFIHEKGIDLNVEIITDLSVQSSCFATVNKQFA